MDDLNVTQVLQLAQAGDAEALKSLYEVLINELEQAARAHLRKRAQPMLQTHALINESFLKLVEQNELGLQNRSHFMAVASTAMRHVLIDHFRRSVAQKRGGFDIPVTLVEDEVAGITNDEHLLVLDEALNKLHQTDARLARVVECKFFGGMNYEEIAEGLGLSARTVRQDWKKAKAWLTLELNPL